MKKLFWVITAILLGTGLIQAQDDTSATYFTYVDSATGDTMKIDLQSLLGSSHDSMEATFEYLTGEVSIGDGIATLKVPEGFKYLGPESSNYVLTQIWGNPEEPTLGMLFQESEGPSSLNLTYAVDITYSADGYIEDEDAADLDYDDLLEEMQSDAVASNEQRLQLGYPTVELVGWAQPPFYDAENKKLHWAKELKFDSNEINTLNYNIRVLGRKGYLNLNVIGDMSNLDLVKSNVDGILASMEFNKGYTYDEFDPEIDKIAAYGIGGLIAGKILAKAGFFALIVKFWKVIAVGAVALFGVFRKKIFGGGGE